MSYLFLMFFSLFFINSTLFSEVANGFLDTEDRKSMAPKSYPLLAPKKDDDINIDKEENDLSEEEIDELESAFEHSPKRAQAILKHLQDPHYFPHNRDYRSAYFVGETGSGKTSTARYIVYEMSKKGWNHKFIGSTELLGEYRNQTAIRLRQELEVAVASKKPTIVVIDELHRLLENTESKHHDTDTAVTAFWLFLDKQRNNKNFFLIGTMNRSNKLPRPCKDRILVDTIKFSTIDDSKVKNALFRRMILSHNMSFDSAVTDEFLDTELAKIGPCTGRKIHKMSKLLFQMQRIESEGEDLPNVVDKEILTKSVALYVELQNDMDYDFVEETDEERQNRHHRENINLQKQHHRETQRLQDQHFAQQQIMQVISSQHRFDPVSMLTSGWHGSRITNCLSNDQIDLAYNIMIQEAAVRNQK